ELRPIPRRRKLIELSVYGARSWALALRVGEASLQAAGRDAGEAVELAEMALWIAEQVPGAESLRTQSLSWAYLARARRAAGDLAGTDGALARCWDLWRAGPRPDREPRPEPPTANLEAFLAASRTA